MAQDVELQKVLRGLMEIAEIAMPDTYYQSDSRLRRARKYAMKHDLVIEEAE